MWFPTPHTSPAKSSWRLPTAFRQIRLQTNPDRAPRLSAPPAGAPSGAERRHRLLWLQLIADGWNKLVFGMITCQNCCQRRCCSSACLDKIRRAWEFSERRNYPGVEYRSDNWPVLAALAPKVWSSKKENRCRLYTEVARGEEPTSPVGCVCVEFLYFQ